MKANTQAEQATPAASSFSPVVALNQFVLRQVGVTDESKYGGFTGSAQTLLGLLQDLAGDLMSRGRRLVKDVEVIHFYPGEKGYEDIDGSFVGTFAVVREGEHVEDVYEARRPGEAPVWVRRVRRRSRPAAGRVDFILYSHDHLGAEASSFAQYELVSINCVVDALPADQDEPPQEQTIWRNYYAKNPDDPQGKGGTYREEYDDPQAFLAELDRSVGYWRDKALVVVDPDAEP